MKLPLFFALALSGADGDSRDNLKNAVRRTVENIALWSIAQDFNEDKQTTISLCLDDVEGTVDRKIRFDKKKEDDLSCSIEEIRAMGGSLEYSTQSPCGSIVNYIQSISDDCLITCLIAAGEI
ncbi:Oidioi.mRNA.OKI2018_I69.chr1.g3864.t1.cds [Oikopleura dioica]|uniref:Oidioi.mRNA.OKI2018_I69.chr1.g3864.t1.cds n=1 Tax=Oikopleura dioica TaxID=34765 RepID=A0ABN7SW07_OIKDI|nr:Oidioi.mRNA.OKI2018_I69.chr1.g3864.t1.cds [Oikopleura dioica]